jgi:putative transcriptional regulator
MVYGSTLDAGIPYFPNLLLPITIAFAMAALAAGAIRLLNLWLNGRLAAAIGSDLSCEAYRRTLYQPYAVNVSDLRKRLSLTQEQFAARFGFSVSTLQHWERGDRSPSGASLVLLNVIDRNPTAVLQALQ